MSSFQFSSPSFPLVVTNPSISTFHPTFLGRNKLSVQATELPTVVAVLALCGSATPSFWKGVHLNLELQVTTKTLNHNHNSQLIATMARNPSIAETSNEAAEFDHILEKLERILVSPDSETEVSLRTSILERRKVAAVSATSSHLSVERSLRGYY